VLTNQLTTAGAFTCTATNAAAPTAPPWQFFILRTQ
jgi:hypothetical protein